MLRPPPPSTLFPYTTLFRSLFRSGEFVGAYGVGAGALVRTVTRKDGSTVVSDGPYLETKKHLGDRKSTRLNSSHVEISYAVFCLKKKKRMRQSMSGVPPYRT